MPSAYNVLRMAEKKAKPWWKKLRWWILGSVATALLAGLYAFFVEPFWVEVTHHQVGEGADQIKILHLTDIHFTRSGSREEKILEVMAKTNPDLIVITGDSNSRGFDVGQLTRFMKQLRAPLGVFACPGNWEDWTEGLAYPAMEEAGVILLSDKTTQLPGISVALSGLSKARSSIPSTNASLHILLSHYPVSFDNAAKSGVDLVLAGHTHGGQIRLPFVGALWLPFDSGEYEAGWYERNGSRMYVSRGVGTSILPIRFLCRPEIAVITVRY